MIYGPTVFGVNEAYLAKHAPTSQMLAWFTNSLSAWNSAFQIIITINIIVHMILLAKMVLGAIVGKDSITIPTK